MDLLCRMNKFKLNVEELILDCITDALFVSFGIIVSFSLFSGEKIKLMLLIIVILIGIPVLLFLMFGIWIPRMRMFDLSKLPLNYTRLTKYKVDEVSNNFLTKLKLKKSYVFSIKFQSSEMIMIK